MGNFILKKRNVFILICALLIIISTSLFLIGEKKFDINPHHLKTHILSDIEIENMQSEDFYRDLIENHTDDLFILSTDLLIQSASSEWTSNSGYEKDELIKKNFFSFIHPKDLPFFANSMLLIVENEEKTGNIDPFRIKEESGSYSLYIATAIPLYNEHEEIVEIALILRDVSVPMDDEANSLETSDI
jgi:PAS domain S-box-containing protein